MIYRPVSFSSRLRPLPDAIMEEAHAGIQTIVAITEHIPVHDTMKAIAYARMEGCNVIGPNCPGLLSPGEVKMGIMPAGLFRRGSVGVISRSGTLTYEVVDELTRAGIGQSTVVGIGGDPVIGQTFVDVLRQFETDPQTTVVVLIGEVGGTLRRKGQGLPAFPSSPTLPAYQPPPTNAWAMPVRLSRAARGMPAPRSPGSGSSGYRWHPGLPRSRRWSGTCSRAGADGKNALKKT